MRDHDLNRKLDYIQKRKQILTFLESNDNAVMVLATSHHDRVIARNVLIANDGFDLYFFTWGQSRKCEQIMKNPKVALCRDDVQIEGKAEIIGGLLDAKYKKYTDMFRNRFPGSVEKWENRPGMVIVHIRPTLIATTGESMDDQIYIDYLDLVNETAYAEIWAYE